MLHKYSSFQPPTKKKKKKKPWKLYKQCAVVLAGDIQQGLPCCILVLPGSF